MHGSMNIKFINFHTSCREKHISTYFFHLDVTPTNSCFSKDVVTYFMHVSPASFTFDTCLVLLRFLGSR